MFIKDFLDFISKLRSSASINHKKAILDEYKDVKIVRELLWFCYDPFLNYYILEPHIATTPFYKPKEFGETEYKEFLLILADANARNSTPTHTASRLQNLLGEMSTDVIDALCCIVEKNLKSGVNVSTINKSFGSGFIPEFPYQRCSLLKEVDVNDWDWKDGHYMQVKADGMYININKYNDGIAFLSRNGSSYDISSFPKLVAEAECLRANSQTHGEIVVKRDGKLLPRQISNGLMNKVLKGQYKFADNEEPCYFAWDNIPLEDVKVKGKHMVEYKHRLHDLLTTTVKNHFLRVIHTEVVSSKKEAIAASQKFIIDGEEGGILKHRDAIWEDGTSKHQVKFKVEFEVDLLVVGFIPGAKDSKNKDTFGSMLCRSSDGLLEVAVPSFTDKKRKEIWDNKDSWINQMVVRVLANNITYPANGEDKCSLFLPRFDEERPEKNNADDLARIILSYESAIKGE